MGTARILVVDDQPDIIKMLEFLLRGQGYIPLAARDGGEALERFAAEAPDLVLLDLNLPVLPGWEVCRQMKAAADTPIIIITGQAPTELKATQLAPGADAYLLKPFEIDDLLAAVRAALEHHAAAVGR